MGTHRTVALRSSHTHSYLTFSPTVSSLWPQFSSVRVWALLEFLDLFSCLVELPAPNHGLFRLHELDLNL